MKKKINEMTLLCLEREKKKKREKRRKARLVYHMTVFKLKLQNIYKKKIKLSLMNILTNFTFKNNTRFAFCF